jgi:hypothetical protein
MTQEIDQNCSVVATVRRTPGHLLTPFGWAADALVAMVDVKPKLLIHLFELDCARMHLIALALAHLNEFSPDRDMFLVSGSVRATIEQILGHYPTGLKRALCKLPSRVMPPESYRHLVELLANPEAAKLLHHARFIYRHTIETLHGLPAPLRKPFIVLAIERYGSAAGFSDGLRLLVSRGAASSFKALVNELSSASQPGQLFAKLRGIVEALPLLANTFPPIQVGDARRLDQAVTIRSLAKDWQNCLARYLKEIDAGTCAVYLWEDSSMPAACLVQKYGRLGWFLEEVKGPRNVDIEPNQLSKIRSAFSDVGIPDQFVIAAIKCMVSAADMDEEHLRIIELEQREIERRMPDPEALDLAAA